MRAAPAPSAKPGDTVAIAVRPEKIALAHEPPAAGLNRVAGEVVDVGYRGDFFRYQVQPDAGAVMKVALANVTRQVARPIALGDRVWLAWAPEAGVVLRE
jgi:putrescine transport system ATP-binding protein